MNWYDSAAGFFAGMFLTNALPHFVHGVSGDRFPTPFAHPPGKGPSSATVNVLWALANAAVGWFLFRHGQVAGGDQAGLPVFFAGVAVMAILLSLVFRNKQAM